MGKTKITSDQKGGYTINPHPFNWGWFILFVICLLAGKDAFVFFLIIYGIAWVFSRM